jgi:hypothetical protein
VHPNLRGDWEVAGSRRKDINSDRLGYVPTDRRYRTLAGSHSRSRKNLIELLWTKIHVFLCRLSYSDKRSQQQIIHFF